MERTILHCDMNNFYASVECTLNPSLREFPVAVCGSMADRHGIVLAKNYLAKGMGVQTGDVIWEAKQKCPGLVVVEPHFEEYIKYSRLAHNIYEEYTNQVEPYGMDECWLDVTGTSHLYGSGTDLANTIRKRIKFELGLTISAGVSFNKIFAKLGSDMKKPDAVTTISSSTFKEQIWSLPAADLLGVGRATSKVLTSFGIHTIGDLARTNPDFLLRRLGKCGLMIWQYANGLDVSLVTKSDFISPIKSVGHGITTTKDLENNKEVWPVILELCQDISHRLRVHQKSCSGVSIFIRDNTLHSAQHQLQLSFPTQSPMCIARTAMHLFESKYDWLHPVRSITVQAICLLPQDAPYQIQLGVPIEKVEKQERLDACVESIRNRFGMHSIQNALLLQPLPISTAGTNTIMPTGMVR